MILKGIIWEDFVNYKLPSTTLLFPTCSFKCGKSICQNNPLLKEPDIDISEEEIITTYLKNPISKSIVFQGLEPMDSFIDIYYFLDILRNTYHCQDIVVIYTGFNEDEVQLRVNMLQESFSNIIIKFGRYIPNQKPHKDPLLQVNLASDNQYAKKIC